jgi:hypothetical protein
MQRHRLHLPPGCVQSNSLSMTEKLLRVYPFLGLLSSSMAGNLSIRGEIKVLRFAGSSFLGDVWIFHRHPGPVVKAGLECLDAIRDGLSDGAGRRQL